MAHRHRQYLEDFREDVKIERRELTLLWEILEALERIEKLLEKPKAVLTPQHVSVKVD